MALCWNFNKSGRPLHVFTVDYEQRTAQQVLVRQDIPMNLLYGTN